MSRISSRSFKVNANQEQMVELTNSSDIAVKVNEIASDLVSDGNKIPIDISGTASNTNDIHVNLKNINSDLVSDGNKIPIDLSGTASNTNAIVIDLDKVNGSAITGSSVPVTFSSSVAGSEGNLENNQSVALNDTSTVYNNSAGNSKHTIWIKGTSFTDNVTVEVSEDNSNFYPISASVFPNSGKAYLTLDGDVFKYIRLKWGGTATAVTATIVGLP
jgi:hypothetical protein